MTASIWIGSAPQAAAQAWLPPKGEGSVSLGYQNVTFAGHFDSSGQRLPLGASQAQSALFDFEYGITDKVALDVALPFIATRYTGANPSSAEIRALFNQLLQQTHGAYTHSFLDNASYHSTFQDFRFNARYKVLSAPIVLTPFITVVIPSHSYAYVGEAAPGRNLREFLIGTNLGRRLNPILPKAYVHFESSYAFVPRTLGVPLNRFNGGITFGYFVRRRLQVRALALYQHTHGGLHFPEQVVTSTPETFLTHDRLLRQNYWHFGGSASYSLSKSVDLFAGVVSFLSGSDTHFGTAITVGTSWNFRTRRAAPEVGQETFQTSPVALSRSGTEPAMNFAP